MKKNLLTLICLMVFSSLFGQDVIKLDNPSFEGIPGPGQAPDGWINCGYNEESASDILPGIQNRFFGVSTKAYDGDTYVGMVVRNNDTRESVGQLLDSSLQKDSTYRFRVFLAHSDRYETISKRTNNPTDYINPATVRLWGGKGECSKEQLLGETEIINHFQWYEYTFEFKPEAEWDFMLIEAYYSHRKKQPYNGHVLVDFCSEIIKRPWKLAPVAPEELSLEDVKNRAELCRKNKIETDKSDKLLIHTLLLNKIFKFETLAASMGIRQYVMSRPFGEVGVSIRCLEKIDSKPLAEIIKKLSRIHLKNQNGDTISREEAAYFENAESLFAKKLEEGELSSALIGYIELNAEALSLELESCY